MKQIDGLTEEDGAVYYEYNGEKINLTEIGDECGQMHMTKAINMLTEKTGMERKLATKLISREYSLTPPNRAKNQALDEEIARLKEAKRQVKEIAAQRKASR